MNLFGLGKPNVKKLKSKNDVEGLIKVLENSRADYDTRRDAAVAIGDIGGAKAIDLLRYTLEDEDVDTRVFSVIALGKMGDEKSINPLVRMLDDEEWHVRELATMSLGIIGEKKGASAVVEPLIKALKDHNNKVREAAMRALKKKRIKNLSKDQARVERFIKATELFEKGGELGKKQEWKDSISALEEAIQLRPDFAKAHEILTVSYLGAMKFDSAKEQYEALKELDKQLAQELEQNPLFNFIEGGKINMF